MILEVISSFTKIFAFINENFGKLLVYLVKYTTCDNLLYHCNSSDEYVLLSRLNKLLK